MMHALGFLHEQNRWERDKHVTVNYDNVQDGKHKPDTSCFGVSINHDSLKYVRGLDCSGDCTEAFVV